MGISGSRTRNLRNGRVVWLEFFGKREYNLATELPFSVSTANQTSQEAVWYGSFRGGRGIASTEFPARTAGIGLHSERFWRESTVPAERVPGSRQFFSRQRSEHPVFFLARFAARSGRRSFSPTNYEDSLASATPHRSDVMECDEDSLAELFYTSGTSANPKGVMLTHRNIYLHAVSVSLRFNTNVDSVELHTIPLFHANGWGAAHSVTFAGARHVMISRFVPNEVFRLIEQERVRSLSLVPIMALALVNCPERPKYDLSSLERISIGGAASSPTLVREVEEKLGCTCFSGYGLTETAPVLSTSPITPGLQPEGDQRFVSQAMTGFAIPGVELRVVDLEDNDVPRDGKTMGEIIARSDGVMAGYWKQPEATAQALRGGWFHTGDMAVMNEDGYILIVDRRKDIIVSGGENISSLEVEKALAAHPSVYEAAVIPVPDEKWGEVPKGLVVVKPGCELSESELLEFCRSRLSHFKCPRSIEFVEVLPKTATGKILKKNLRKKYWTDETIASPEFARRK